jgi:predicted AlkP superfamily pyrophosphatase or phosphodiesterase
MRKIPALCGSAALVAPLMVFILFSACISSGARAEQDLLKDKLHVVFIGLDGWGAYSLPAADMPTVKEMMAEGSYTLEALGVMPSDSACNWASLFMGADPSLHGYTRYNSREPEFPPAALDSHGFFPTIFALLRDQKPKSRIAYFYEWAGMRYLIPLDVPDKMRMYPIMSYTYLGVTSIAGYIKREKPDLTAVIFYKADLAGHSKGHDTPAYYKALNDLDKRIALIVKAVREAGIYDNTIFIFSADHGGVGKGHGGDSLAERQVPLIFCGKDIRKGHRISPGVRNYDLAPTIAAMFGLRTPDVWIGKPITEIFTRNE